MPRSLILLSNGGGGKAARPKPNSQLLPDLGRRPTSDLKSAFPIPTMDHRKNFSGAGPPAMPDSRAAEGHRWLAAMRPNSRDARARHCTTEGLVRAGASLRSTRGISEEKYSTGKPQKLSGSQFRRESYVAAIMACCEVSESPTRGPKRWLDWPCTRRIRVVPCVPGAYKRGSLWSRSSPASGRLCCADAQGVGEPP